MAGDGDPPQSLPDPNVADGGRLDVERLEVYQAALEFQAFANALPLDRAGRELRDQLRRASISIPLNIAEAVGRRTPVDRARFLGIARGSASESAAILDIVRISSLAPHADIKRGRALLVRIVAMLTRWCQQLDSTAPRG